MRQDPYPEVPRQAYLACEGSLDALATYGDRQTLDERYHAALARLTAAERALGRGLP